MFQPAQAQIKCPNCGQPFVAQLEQIVDGGQDPQAKLRLLSGRVNSAVCPNCHYEFRIGTPLVYHDAEKELLLVHVPMELGMPQAEQDRMIGSMTNAVMNSLPAEQRKAYLFMPRSMLTLQGMIETIMEADGITKDVIEARRQKMRMIEEFIQADPETWPEMIKARDAEIDQQFVEMLNSTADAAAMNGRQDIAATMLELRDQMMEHSTAGQQLLVEVEAQEAIITAVAERLNALGRDATRDDLLDLIAEMAAEDDAETKLSAVVTLARAALDYELFMKLSERVGEASGEEKERLGEARDLLLRLTREIDQQAEQVTRRAASTLRALMEGPDLDNTIRTRLNEIDDTFMSVLAANIQHAQETGNTEVATRLQEIADRVMTIVQESAPPAVRFVNEMLSQPSFEESRAMLLERGRDFGPGLVQLFDILIQELSAGRPGEVLERLRALRDVAAGMFDGQEAGTDAPSFSGDGRDESESPIILPFSRRRQRPG
jgi:hypothetical protein